MQRGFNWLSQALPQLENENRGYYSQGPYATRAYAFYVPILPKDILFIAYGDSRKLLVWHRIGGIFRHHKIGTGLLRSDDVGERKRSLDSAIVVTNDVHRTGPNQRRLLFYKISQLVLLQPAILDRIASNSVMHHFLSGSATHPCLRAQADRSYAIRGSSDGRH
jgi:hypothetical protein